jgi:L-ascorbate metabolism protein UlaG (beta-lactamase superfamily)
VKITLVRHATLLLDIGGRRLLVDPMLDDQGAHPPIDNTPNPRRNPLVPLPMPAEEVVRELDGVVITHLHPDHLDATATRLLPRDVPVLCQPPDQSHLRQLGLDAVPVAESTDWLGLRIHRTGGRHGTGEIGAMLAPVSGFVIDGLYIAGDTIWCDEVAAAIERHRPAVAVVNAGGARFLQGDRIVMAAADVSEVVARVPRVVAVHMEAINHCVETRAELRAAVPQVLIPADGETVDVDSC